MKVPYSAVIAQAALLLAGAAPVLAQSSDGDRGYRYYHGPGMMWGGDYGGMGMVFGPLFMLLLLAAIVVAIVYLLRMLGVGGIAPQPGKSANNALDLLKERYARGEIDSKEFDERKRLLSD